MKKKYKTDEELLKIIHDKEPQANISIAYVLTGIGVIYIIVFILTLLHVYEGNMTLAWISLFSNAMLLFISAFISIIRKGQDTWIKYMYCAIMLMSAFEVHLFTGYKVWMLFAVPIVISLRYFNKNLTHFTGVISALFIFLSGIFCAFFAEKIGYTDLNMISYNNPVTLNVTSWLFEPVITSGIDKTKVYLNTLRLQTIPNLLLVGIFTGISMLIIDYVHTLMVNTKKAGEEKNRLELEMEASKSRIMMSQIQPHFLYNTLSAIMAIKGNPDETVDALGEFGKYLRENLDSLSKDDLVPFSKEMQHVVRYVSLEHLRFKDKIKIIWNTEETSFLIPSLSLQMLVENAIKHGITTKEEGGTITITSGKNNNEYFVNVEDDGMGFDINAPLDNTHIGLENVRKRVEYLCKGNIDIKSEIGKGTSVTIHIPKEVIHENTGC